MTSKITVDSSPNITSDQASLVSLFYDLIRRCDLVAANDVCHMMSKQGYPKTIIQALQAQLESIQDADTNISTRQTTFFTSNIDDDNPHINSELRLFGQALLGPCLLVFYKRLISAVELLDTPPKLYFLSREGFFLQQGFDCLANTLGLNIQSEYLITSRTLVFRALIDNTKAYPLIFSHAFEGKLSDLLRFRCGIEVDEICEFDIPPSFDNGLDTTISLKADYVNIISMLQANMSMLRRIASRTSSVYIDYLNSIGFNDNGVPHVVDIGYSGTIQKGLSLLINAPTYGHYVITTTPPTDEHSNKFRGYLYNQQQWGQGSPLLEHSLFLEAVLTAPTGSAINIQRDTSGFLFTYGKTTASQAGFSRLQMIFDGALQYCKQAIEYGFDMTPSEASHLYHLLVSSKHHFPKSALEVMEIDDEFSGLGFVKPIDLYHY